MTETKISLPIGVFDEKTSLRFREIGKLKNHKRKIVIQARFTRVNSLLIPLSNPIYGYFDDPEKLITQYAIGEIIGLTYAFKSQPLPFNLISQKDAQILEIPFTQLRSLMDHDANLRWQIIDYMATKLLEAEIASSSVVSKDSSVRLAQLLVEISNRQLSNGSAGRETEIKLSQQELGMRIGASRQTINKYIQQFILNGYIKKSGHSLVILSPSALSEYIRTS